MKMKKILAAVVSAALALTSLVVPVGAADKPSTNYDNLKKYVLENGVVAKDNVAAYARHIWYGADNKTYIKYVERTSDSSNFFDLCYVFTDAANAEVKADDNAYFEAPKMKVRIHNDHAQVTYENTSEIDGSVTTLKWGTPYSDSGASISMEYRMGSIQKPIDVNTVPQFYSVYDGEIENMKKATDAMQTEISAAYKEAMPVLNALIGQVLSDTTLGIMDVVYIDKWADASNGDNKDNTSSSANNKKNNTTTVKIPDGTMTAAGDNIAPVTSDGKINKLQLDFSKADTSVSTNKLVMTVVKGSKLVTTEKVKSATPDDKKNIKVKINKKTSIATVSPKKTGTVSFELENGKKYTVSFKVDVPKVNKEYKKITADNKERKLYVSQLYGTQISAGSLTAVSKKGTAVVVDGNAQCITFTPAAGDTLKVVYQYLNKKYKLNIKIKP